MEGVVLAREIQHGVRIRGVRGEGGFPQGKVGQVLGGGVELLMTVSVVGVMDGGCGKEVHHLLHLLHPLTPFFSRMVPATHKLTGGEAVWLGDVGGCCGAEGVVHPACVQHVEWRPMNLKQAEQRGEDEIDEKCMSSQKLWKGVKDCHTFRKAIQRMLPKLPR